MATIIAVLAKSIAAHYSYFFFSTLHVVLHGDVDSRTGDVHSELATSIAVQSTSIAASKVK
jgi:hypothetical protein